MPEGRTIPKARYASKRRTPLRRRDASAPVLEDEQPAQEDLLHDEDVDWPAHDERSLYGFRLG